MEERAREQHGEDRRGPPRFSQSGRQNQVAERAAGGRKDQLVWENDDSYVWALKESLTFTQSLTSSDSASRDCSMLGIYTRTPTVYMKYKVATDVLTLETREESRRAHVCAGSALAC